MEVSSNSIKVDGVLIGHFFFSYVRIFYENWLAFVCLEISIDSIHHVLCIFSLSMFVNTLRMNHTHLFKGLHLLVSGTIKYSIKRNSLCQHWPIMLVSVSIPSWWWLVGQMTSLHFFRLLVLSLYDNNFLFWNQYWQSFKFLFCILFQFVYYCKLNYNRFIYIFFRLNFRKSPLTLNDYQINPHHFQNIGNPPLANFYANLLCYTGLEFWTQIA